MFNPNQQTSMKAFTDLIAKYQPLFESFDNTIAALRVLIETKRTQKKNISDEHSRLRTEYGMFFPRNPTDARKIAVDKTRMALLKEIHSMLDAELSELENDLNAIAVKKVMSHKAFDDELCELLESAVHQLGRDDVHQIHTEHLDLLLQKKTRLKPPAAIKNDDVDIKPEGTQVADIVALLNLSPDGTQAEEKQNILNMFNPAVAEERRDVV